METMMRAKRAGLTLVGCAMGTLLLALSGCRQKQATSEQTPTIPEVPPTTAEAMIAGDGWVNMETMAPGKWVGIESATDLNWNEETRVMRIGVGTDLNGLRWSGELPTVPYAVELEARRMSGSDFFCGLTFPVRNGNEFVSLILGGWGGNIVGISSIDGLDASENSSGSRYEFEDQRWYRIRVEVGDERLQVWIDDQQVIDAYTEEQKLSLRPGPIEQCAPFGLATWMTSAEVRGVKWRRLGN